MTAPVTKEVYLTPSHFFDEPTQCFRRGRGGEGWKQTTDHGHDILEPMVYWWLRENVGYEMNEVWDVDRFFYPGEALPELPRGHGGDWRAAGRECFYGRQEGREYSYHRGEKIYFPVKKHAVAFHKRFASWHTNWNILVEAAKKRYAWKTSKALNAHIRTLDRPIWGIGSHELRPGQTFAPLENLGLFSYAVDHPTHGLRRFSILHDEQDKLLFQIAAGIPTEIFIAKSSRAAKPVHR